MENNKSLLRNQLRFKREKHVFIEQINKISLNSNDDK